MTEGCKQVKIRKKEFREQAEPKEEPKTQSGRWAYRVPDREIKRSGQLVDNQQEGRWEAQASSFLTMGDHWRVSTRGETWTKILEDHFGF